MSKTNPPIVVVAYNRPRALSRLLKSLTCAHYPDHDIRLIISIDRSDHNSEVLKIANEFQWKQGPKKVIYQKNNLGLKKHILQCGDLSIEFGHIIILEDDLFVSPNFYFFTCSALKFVEGNDRIGGISLYNHQFNVHTGDHFSALQDGYDNWYFQFASSWGQAWSSKHWSDFKSWLSQNEDLATISGIPENVKNWSDKSWLKLFIAYLVQEDIYFLYPKVSLTTNFSDAGTHVSKDSTLFQVPLLLGFHKSYNFLEIENSQAVYDAYFENIRIPEIAGLEKNNCCIDLHGYKSKAEERYWLTDRILDYEILSSYSRSLKPIEANIIYGIEGEDLFLYDTLKTSSNKLKYNSDRRIFYNIKLIHYKDLMRTALRMTIEKRHSLYNKVKDWLK